MNQKRTCGIVTLVIMSLCIVFEVAGQDTNTEKAVAYLVSKQNEEGSWNQDQQKKLVDSFETFRALHRVNGGENALNNALKYFSTLPEILTILMVIE